MMTTLLQLGLSISVICNCITIWGVWKVISSMDSRIDALSALSTAILDGQLTIGKLNQN